VLVFQVNSKQPGKVFAAGIRNCVGLTLQPGTGDLWCTTNERDLLGDDLVPDYSTRVREGGFYGWPWYYMGPNEDPRLKAERPDLKDKVLVPDVPYQAHSAALGLVFYTATAGKFAFPAEYVGDGFAMLHGSWNRGFRTGHKVVRVRMKNGVPTGEYQDFVTGFIVDDGDAWGRPVSAVVLKDGSLLFSDDGADVISVLHSNRREQLGDIIAGTEETTTGVIRLKALEAEGKLGFPIIAVNEAMTKHMFDNRYGTGQSTIDGIIRATNVLLAGKKFVVGGYGWVGRGVASRARGLGAHVIITEVDPMRALEASMDGFEVLTMQKAAETGDIFCTATGDKHVITREHFEVMKDGAILSNTGHFNVEIEIQALRSLARETRIAREYVEEFTMADGRRLYLIADGRLVNLSAAEGHPALVMDMSFANQALGVEYAAQHAGELEHKVYPVPAEIDKEIARLKLATMGIEIDVLTEEQEKYLASWDEGT